MVHGMHPTRLIFNPCNLRNLWIKKERSIPEIVLFKLHLDRDREFVTAIDLGPTGQTGREFMNPFPGQKKVGSFYAPVYGAWNVPYSAAL